MSPKRTPTRGGAIHSHGINNIVDEIEKKIMDLKAEFIGAKQE